LKQAFACLSCSVNHIKYEGDKDSALSALGTEAHRLLEECLTKKQHPKTLNIEEDMRKAISEAYDYISVLPNCTYERRVHPFAPDTIEGQMCHGTADVISDNYPYCLEVADYKHGEFSLVEVDENPQLMAYALGAAEGREYAVYRITVIQPRHHAGGISSWEFDHATLMKFRDKLRNRLLEIHAKYLEDVGPCGLTEDCVYSRFKIEAPVVKDLLNFAPKIPYKLDMQLVKDILMKQKCLERLIVDCERYMLEHLSAGNTEPGFVLEQRYSNQKWNASREELVEEFGDKILDTVLLTPSQAAKRLGVSVKDFTTREETYKKLKFKPHSLFDDGDD
jgi:hypothetical protein